MKNLLVLLGLMVSVFTAKAQYDYSYDNSYDNGPNIERHFYDEEFDWRWDVRVRISDGIRSGRITNFEANNLYRRLERIERQEYAFQADGFFSDYEQNEIWNEVKWLNRQIGIDLRDFDRRYYGYAYVGGFRGYNPFYFGRNYDFYRFDRRGYGSVRIGYNSRHFVPVNHYYGRNNRNYGYNNNRYSNNNRNGNNNANRNNNNRLDNNKGNNSNKPRGEDRNTKSSEWNNRFDNNRNNGSSNKTPTDRGNSDRRENGSDVNRGSSNGRQATPQKSEKFERRSLPDRSKAQSSPSRGSNGVQ